MSARSVLPVCVLPALIAAAGPPPPPAFYPHLIKDINPGSEYGAPDDLTLVGDRVFFRATDGVHGFELWVTDGTTDGTYMVKDINPGLPDGYPDAMAAVGNRLFFQANNGVSGVELWVSDGTEVGTIMFDLWPGSASSNPADVNNLGDPGKAFNGKYYFAARDGTHGREFWVSDGTLSGTHMVKDISPGVDNSHSEPEWITVFGNRLYFNACGPGSGMGCELWMSDGTEDGTSIVRNINPTGSSRPGPIVAANQGIFFEAADAVFNQELWFSDGTTNGTYKVREIHPTDGSDPSFLTPVGNTVFFSAYDANNDNELWKSDGTEAGTVRVKDIRPDGSSFPTIIRESVDGNLLYFMADDGVHGYELWVTDGTEVGTRLLKDINPTGDSWALSVFRLGSCLLLSADDGVHGREFWITDGTEEGTRLALDLEPGPGGTNPNSIAMLNGVLLFSGNDGATGIELWALDSTPCRIPAVTGWGLTILGLLVMAVASLRLRRSHEDQRRPSFASRLTATASVGARLGFNRAGNGPGRRDRRRIMCTRVRAGSVVGVFAAIWFMSSPWAFGEFKECEMPMAAHLAQQCPMEGGCVAYSERDLWSSEGFTEAQWMHVRAKVHVFNVQPYGGENGVQLIQAHLDKTAEYFEPYGIQLDFAAPHRILDASSYNLVDSEGEIDDMKSTFAESPTTQLNVYVSNFYDGEVFGGRGYYPWGEDATGDQGGIMIHYQKFGEDRTTLAHEIGHALGLWHTHHGNDHAELSNHGGGCSQYTTDPCECNCQEPVGVGCPYRDQVGDFCCDTPATPPNTIECAEPTASYPCAEPYEWDATDYTNFLGWNPDSENGTPCRDHFTTQQNRRMLCWACDTVVGWIDDADCNENDVPDVCDIARGDSQDCNHDGVPNECEAQVFGACCTITTPPPTIHCTNGVQQSCCPAPDAEFHGSSSICSQVDCFIELDLPQINDDE